MNSPLFSCRDVQHWLQTTIKTLSLAEASQAFNQHLSKCAVCRGAIYEFIRLELLADHAPSANCDQCQDLLADFITLEQQDSLAALQRYPEVWLHLWFCDPCLETYSALSGVIAEQPGLLEAQRWVAPSISDATQPTLLERFKPLLTMLRSTLSGLPTPFELQSAFRNDGAMGYLVRPFGAYPIDMLAGEIHAFDESDGLWTLEVTISPAWNGRLKAQIGNYSQISPIPLEGPVIFTNIPQDQLISDTTDLVFSIELTDAA